MTELFTTMTELILDLVCHRECCHYLLLIFVLFSSHLQMIRKVAKRLRENLPTLTLLSSMMARRVDPAQRVEEVGDVVHNNLYYFDTVQSILT